ncbi:unnamed protein product, partial [Prorocentrum cordatum]
MSGPGPAFLGAALPAVYPDCSGLNGVMDQLLHETESASGTFGEPKYHLSNAGPATQSQTVEVAAHGEVDEANSGFDSIYTEKLDYWCNASCPTEAQFLHESLGSALAQAPRDDAYACSFCSVRIVIFPSSCPPPPILNSGSSGAVVVMARRPRASRRQR